MSRTIRIRKNGKRVYEIRYSRGRDILSGKQLKPYSVMWEVPDTLSDAKADKKAAVIEADFIAKCKNGEILTKEEQKQKELQEAEQAQIKKKEYSECPTVKEYSEIYILFRSTESKPGTVANTIKPPLKRLCNSLGDLRILDVTKLMMKKFANELFSSSGLRYDTANNNFIQINRFFESAVEEGIITENPMNGIRKPRKSKETEDDSYKKFFTVDELNKIAEGMENEPFMWKVIFYVALDTGCRAGEITGMKWEHINMETGVFKVCNNVQYTNDKGVYETTPKTGKFREIVISNPVLNMLRKWKEVQKVEKIYNKGTAESVYCFESPYGGGHMCNATINTHFRKFGEKYGINDFHAHKLRHTMATYALQTNQIDIATLSKKLGHASIATTAEYYLHTNEKAQRNASEIYANELYKNFIEMLEIK